MKSIEIDMGGPVMPRSKSRAIVRSLVSSRAFEVAHPRGPNASGSEAVVQPSGGAAAEIGTDGVVDRRKHLKSHEHGRDEQERQSQIVTTLDRPHKPSNRDGKQSGQDPPQHEHRPPSHRQGTVSLRQNLEELPLVACPEVVC